MKVQPFVDQLEQHDNQSDKKHRENADIFDENFDGIRFGDDIGQEKTFSPQPTQTKLTIIDKSGKKSPNAIRSLNRSRNGSKLVLAQTQSKM